MKFNSRWLSLAALPTLLLGALILAGTACVRHRTNVVDHTVVMRNAGAEVILDYQVTYGQIKFPEQPSERFGPIGGRSYTMTMPVPEAATVVWTTQDQQRHRENVQVWRYVKDKRWFFQRKGEILFEVDGPVLRVYRVRWIANDKRPVREQIH